MPATRPSFGVLRTMTRANTLADEGSAVDALIDLAALGEEERHAISNEAARLVAAVRNSTTPSMMEAFLGEYGLSTKEGVALMCLAEALLRVPDSATMDDLIADKVAPHDWAEHSGQSSSIMVNASTWALMLTGRVLDDEDEAGIEGTLRSLVRRIGEPVIRRAVSVAMREMGDQFVLGETISKAVKRGGDLAAKGYLYSYDMLGEAARTERDALRYHQAYANAIGELARSSNKSDIRDNPGISVKLSALHPRYEATQRDLVVPVLADRLLTLAVAAKDARMGLNVDAEEADRLDLSLYVIEKVLADPALVGWDGFGVVVQAYGQRAPCVLDWLHALAERLDRKIMVRLVKGAYWDTEIKRAQVLGLSGFPVFTRKQNTDVSYLACARKLLSMTSRIYPQFATHNAHTVASVLAMAEDRQAFEFQRLHGMGEALHEVVRKEQGTRCRIYAPVGQHEDLLAYLVRRLLENGANSSFVNQIVDETVKPETIAADPIEKALNETEAANPAIAKPSEIFLPERLNAKGWDITDPEDITAIKAARDPFLQPYQWRADPMIADGQGESEATISVTNPANPDEVVGLWRPTSGTEINIAVDVAMAAQPGWAAISVAERASLLRRVAELYEENAGEFFALAAREAGKTLADCIAELREAVDFLNYYAARAGDVEEGTSARGVIVCISPWNFPLAIFTGQIAAALVTGNAVIAKPAEQTPLIAARAVALIREAGVPKGIIQLLPGTGESVGAALTAHPDIAGVCFTGSTDVARIIECQLAETAPPDAMLIAETGGLNAMIVDSTALPEQAVRDIVASAFQSAGQRCSALRVLYVQEDVAGKMLEMLTGALQTLTVGDPLALPTDVGPVIDEDARRAISNHCRAAEAEGRLIAGLDAPDQGLFCGPSILRVSGIGDLEREIFGPVLHVATFKADKLDEVIADINARGYGLTFGLHTRIDERVQRIVDAVHAGNIYVNRNQIGAVVGSQPFGGEGLSGTGPKAGGPHYLRQFRKGLDATVAAEGRPADPHAVRAALQSVAQHAPVARRNMQAALASIADDVLAAAMETDTGPVELPGPTGEANTLVLVPRGTALCLGPSHDALCAQMVQALAMGNRVVAAAPDAPAALQPLLGKGLPLALVDGVLAADALETMDVNLVASMASDHDLRLLRRALARRKGPIVPLVSDRIHPAAYALERAVCVDTTAAGGNAGLLAVSA